MRAITSEAMWLALQQLEPDDYVIATGETHSVQEFLDAAFSYVGLDWKKYVEIDPKLVWAAEVDRLARRCKQGLQAVGMASGDELP